MNESTFRTGACRILFHNRWLSNTIEWKNIVDPLIFEKKNGWEDIGATKTGFLIDSNGILSVGLAEMTSERLSQKLSGSGFFSLAILYETKEELTGIGMRFFSTVEFLGFDGDFKNVGECASLPARFQTYERAGYC